MCEALILPWRPPATDLQLRPFRRCPSFPRSFPPHLAPLPRQRRASQGPWVGLGLQEPLLGPAWELARERDLGERGVAFSLRREKRLLAWAREQQLGPVHALRGGGRVPGCPSRRSVLVRTPLATAETATPLSRPLPSGPVASMTLFVPARRPHPLISLLVSPAPRSEPSLSADGRQGAPATRSGQPRIWV